MVLERRASRHLWLHDAGQLRGCDEAVAVFVEGLESLPVVGDGWVGKVLIHDLKFERNFSRKSLMALNQDRRGLVKLIISDIFNLRMLNVDVQVLRLS